jgi:hypothetical protein
MTYHIAFEQLKKTLSTLNCRQPGHDSPIELFCAHPSCPKKFLCVKCILQDKPHFEAHKEVLTELHNFTDTLKPPPSYAEMPAPLKAGAAKNLNIIQGYDEDFSTTIEKLIQETEDHYDRTYDIITGFLQHSKKRTIEG